VKEEAVIKCAIVDDESTVVEIPIDKTESPEP
jgi:hypothetical protein